MKESNKRSSLIAAIIVSVAPIFFLIPLPALANLKTYSLYASSITGYIGVILLLWMFLLGTRATSSFLFHDTAPIIKIHSWLGKYGSIAILLHPLFIIYSYGESLFYAIVPHIGTQFERHVTLGRIAFWLVVLVWITSAVIRDRIKYRPWKYIHYLAYISLPFSLLHIPDVGSQFMKSSVIKAYYFIVIVAFLFFVLLRLRSLLNLNRHEYQITRQKQLNDDTYSLYLRPYDTSITPPRRGQYIYLKLGIVSEDHPFSVMHYDNATGEIIVTYRIYGTFTDSLSHKPAGTTVNISGPYGSFTENIKTIAKPIVFIAGGIGITPFVDHILHGDDVREQWLFYASSTPDHAVYLPQLRKALGRHCIPIYSRATAISPSDETGHIDADKIQRYLPSTLSTYHYYICGPQGMIDAVRSALTSLGVSLSQIETEEFSF